MEIKVQYFGPIQEGLIENKGYMPINDLTVFIGNQGTGKSTITKLISTFCWLEKSLYRGIVKASSLNDSSFKKKYCKYQKVNEYFSSRSYIHFKGNIYEFEYKNNVFTVTNLRKGDYLLPQIMYIPAERNFLSTVDRYQSLESLPAPLYTFSEEFEKAEKEYKSGISLPIGNIKFEYNPFNKLAYIKGKNYKIRLSEASSGIQSMVPLYIVSQSLANSISKESDPSESEKSLEERRKLEEEVKNILLNTQISEEVKISSLKVISSKFKKACFINIVEEIEQNLYPNSQKHILFKLVEFLNMMNGNKLILNTHSPYIINYLTLLIKAKKIMDIISNNEEAVSRIAKIIPIKSCIDADRISIFEIGDNGIVKILPSYNGIPSDTNFLNISLADINLLYDQLQDIEEEYED